MYIKNSLILLLFSITFSCTAQVLARFPDVDPSGKKIAFSYQGDIWIIAEDGANARRLTIHEAYDSHPRWSRDGTKIAFVSNRYGNRDIFTVDVRNGDIKRKTFYSSNDMLPSWKPDGNLVFRTDREYQQVEREDEIYEFEKDLATPSRTMDAFALAAEPSFNHPYWILTKGYCRSTREKYTGPAQQELWLYHSHDKTFKKLTDHKSQDIQARWAGDDIFILSARNGTYNIYRTSFKNNNTDQWEQITNVEKPGIRYFSVDSAASTIVYERGDAIYVKNNNLPPKKLNLTLPGDFRFYPEEYKTYQDNLNEYAITSDEKYVALQIHGELFLTANDKEIERTVRLTDHPYKDSSPAWMNDSTLFFISDRTGSEAVFKIESRDPGLSDLFWSFDRKMTKVLERDGIITHLSFSPSKDKLAITYEPGVLEVAEVDSLGNIGRFTTLTKSWAMPNDISWSPDGNWIAFSRTDLNFNREVFIQPADGHMDPVNISMHPRSDRMPVWSRNGNKLAFISNRNNGDNDIWLVWLQKEDYLKEQSDWEELKQYPKVLKERLQIKTDTAKSDSITVDTKDIYRRLTQVTSYAGEEYSVAFGKDGEHLFFVRANKGENDLMKIKWTGEDPEKITDAKGLSNLRLSPQGDHLHFIKSGKFYSYKIDGEKPENIPFKARMKVDFRRENEQVFEEAWRQLKANFYDPNFHGKDFGSLKRLYKPIALKASTKQDFRDMFNEMLGQINASHMGLYGGDREDVQNIHSGKIGAELKATERGMKVMRVIPESPAAKEESRLYEGDIIVAIDGEEVIEGENFYKHLENKAGERIWMKVLGINGEERSVYIKCKSSVDNELYEEWVARNRMLTDTYSNGRLGYIHIRGMNWSSFEAFERELMASGHDKDGIILDVRFNGGGWTTDMLMTVLSVRQHAYTIPRGALDDLDDHEQFREYYPYGERLPLSAWTKPSAALCNSTSYSNAEIFSHAYKNLDIGPLVGEPTFGAVISTGGARLLDGSFVRLPFRGWFVKETGNNMDFQPAVPDYIVSMPPGIKGTCQDPQLKKAVDVLLKDL